jgi:hypothetical protein
MSEKQKRICKNCIYCKEKEIENVLYSRNEKNKQILEGITTIKTFLCYLEKPTFTYFNNKCSIFSYKQTIQQDLNNSINLSFNDKKSKTINDL